MRTSVNPAFRRAMHAAAGRGCVAVTGAGSGLMPGPVWRAGWGRPQSHLMRV
jgi:hypothetical protein